MALIYPLISAKYQPTYFEKHQAQIKKALLLEPILCIHKFKQLHVLEQTKNLPQVVKYKQIQFSMVQSKKDFNLTFVGKDFLFVRFKLSLI